uniref:NADH dehydrogenase subunit 5 n=1 Tax=Ischnodemus noctulus TaxID=2969361 RepID=UPI002176BFA0|nr:NADH dehydrogenase subunit 5 [Ischnodemus noctulus]UUJ37784.1 NADH dehydrogenase subunit 5 [Ischnodemus noctulus]
MNLYVYWFLILFIFGSLFYLMGINFIYFDSMVLMDFDILEFNSCPLSMTLLFDWISMIFMGSVMYISSMVILYSNSYMAEDLDKIRFLFLVILFVISMCLMILSPNLVSILLGWDGLGLISYCLVIYFSNYNSYNAGMLTILSNRIGDVCILLAIGALFNSGSFNFMNSFFYLSNWGIYLFLLISLASFTKSAQIPFSSWLPAAMAAPTPVSALVHSSTLVTAGVYLLIRFSDFLYLYDSSFFLLLSIMTMFMSGLGANCEFDLKKIIALSTLSQLGLMMSILFMGYPLIAFMHLITHAFFKALLFLCAGLFIHSMNNSQDIRYMGGFLINFPYTSSCFLISSMSLCGLPFLSGFYSKDYVLEQMSLGYYNIFIYMIFYISVGLTVCYSMRLCYYCLFSYYSMLSFNLYGEDFLMACSMILLSFMSIFIGSTLMWMIIPFPSVIVMPFLLKLMSFLFILFGGWLGYEFSVFYYYMNLFGIGYNFSYNFFSSMWFMPYLSTYHIYNYYGPLSLNYMKSIDHGWGEFLMSKYLVYISILFSKFNSYIQNNGLKLLFILYLFTFFMFIII